MDYRKIGRVLEHDDESSPVRPAQRGNSLRDRPLGELGLTGLVERLALAIQRASPAD